MRIAGGARSNSRAGAGRWRKFTGRDPWGREALGLLLPGLILFGLFLVQPESALSNGPALLIDNLLRALALISVAGAAVVVFGEDRAARRGAVIASAVCVLLGVAVLSAGLWTPFRDWWAMVAAAVATAAASVNLYRQRRVWSGIKGLTSKVVIGVLTVAAVPAFNFWTETSYLPSRNAASLELSTEAVVQQAADGSAHWVITSTLRNLSPVRAFVIISGITACRRADEGFWQQAPPFVVENSPQDQCEQLSPPFNEGSWLDPDATLTNSIPARLDSTRELLQVSLRVAYARADRVIEVLDSERDATTEEQGACEGAQVVDLQPPSRLSALARRELALMYAQVAEDGGRTYFFGAADHLSCGRKPDSQGENEYRFQLLNQYLSLTEATTVWAGWPKTSPPPE